MSDTLRLISEAGVAVWLDDLSRDRITTGNLAEAAAVLNLAGEIRGYGPVKDEAVANYRRKLATLESLMSASPNTHSEESRVFGAESRDQTST